jgi:Zn ribbon nucleic-acid-binding protein
MGAIEMKLKPQTPITDEQRAARKAAEALFGDLLTPTPKGAAKVAAKKAVERGTIANPANPDYFTTVERQFHIVKQECLTCGHSHSYALTKMVKFRAKRRKDGLMIEIPCILPTALNLPARIVHSYETTDFCPNCVELCSRVDALALWELSETVGQQGVLFK